MYFYFYTIPINFNSLKQQIITIFGVSKHTIIIKNMFYMRFILLLLTSLIITGSLTAQDIHFTQYNLAPLSLNPALIGQFEGTFRIGGIYRDQDRSVNKNPFATASVFLDAPIFRGFGKNDWIGIGAVVLNDKAGTVSFNNTQFLAGLSYHLALGSKANTIISLGAEGGFVQKRIDKSAAESAQYLQSGGLDNSDIDNNVTNDNISYADFNTGISLRSALNKSMDFTLGFAVHHIAEPTYTGYTEAAAATIPDELEKQPRRLAGHAEFNIDLAPKWTLSPSLLYQRITKAQETAVQAIVGRHFNAEKDITFRFGAGYRTSDALEAHVGFDYKGLRIGAAYDITLSDKSTANLNQGGFEIAAAYIAKIRKAPVVKPVIFCPRF